MTDIGAPGAQEVPESQRLTVTSPDPDKRGLFLSSSVDYSVGRYGGPVTTQVLRFAEEADWWLLPESLDVKLTVPYLWQHGLGVTARLGIDTQGNGQQAKSTNGPGDVLLEGGYVFLKDKGWIPEVRGFAEVKFPTASFSERLGTGKFDEAVGANLSKSLTDALTALMDVSYTFVGSPPGIPLRDIFAWSVGLAWGMTSSLQLTGFVEGATPAQQDIAGALDLRAEIEYKLTPRVKFTNSISVGLTSGAPAFAITGEFRYSF